MKKENTNEISNISCKTCRFVSWKITPVISHVSHLVSEMTRTVLRFAKKISYQILAISNNLSCYRHSFYSSNVWDKCCACAFFIIDIIIIWYSYIHFIYCFAFTFAVCFPIFTSQRCYFSIIYITYFMLVYSFSVCFLICTSQPAVSFLYYLYTSLQIFWT